MQADGLWLVGVGALLLALVGLSSAPLRLHLQFGGLGDTRRDRIGFACTGLGLLTTATGSFMVAIGSSPSAEFVVLTCVALVTLAWLLLAWRVHALWAVRREDAAADLQFNRDLAREAWRFEAATLLARWSWALCHPLTATDANSWPYPYLVARIGEEPPGIDEGLRSDTGLKLRHSWPDLVQTAPAELPGWIRDVAAVAQEQHWVVARRGVAIVFYTPDGRQHVTADLQELPVVQDLVRDKLLRELQALGLPTHNGARGRLMPGRDTSQLVGAVFARRQESEASSTPGS